MHPDEILRAGLPDRHRREQFLDVGGFQEILTDAQLRQVERVIADGVLDHLKFRLLGHRESYLSVRGESPGLRRRVFE